MSEIQPEPASNFRTTCDVVIGLLCAGTAAILAGLVFGARAILGRRSQTPRVPYAR